MFSLNTFLKNALNNIHLKKIIVSLLCLGIVAFILLKPQTKSPETPFSDNNRTEKDNKQALTPPADHLAVEIKEEQPHQQVSAFHNNEHHNNEQHIAELIKQRLTPEMRAEINTRLNPPNESYTEIKTEQGGYVNLGKRAASVSIAIIDDNGNTVVTDITSPLTE